MDACMRRKQSFLLRLPCSIRDQATKIAHEEGTSLNHFIAIAVAEKLSRMGQDSVSKPTHALPTPMIAPTRLH
jgi:hypothetical protein